MGFSRHSKLYVKSFQCLLCGVKCRPSYRFIILMRLSIICAAKEVSRLGNAFLRFPPSFRFENLNFSFVYYANSQNSTGGGARGVAKTFRNSLPGGTHGSDART